MQDIRRAFPATLELATLGTIIGAGLGVPLGVWAAVRRGGLPDQVVRVMGLIGYSAPIFWLGLMALVVFYARLGWVGGPGRIDVVYEFTLTPVTGLLLVDTALEGEWQAFGNALSHLILPASLLGLFLAGLHQPDDALVHAERARARNTWSRRGPRASRRRGSSGGTRCATRWCRWSP